MPIAEKETRAVEATNRQSVKLSIQQKTINDNSFDKHNLSVKNLDYTGNTTLRYNDENFSTDREALNKTIKDQTTIEISDKSNFQSQLQQYGSTGEELK